jgi:hypothetical protein
MKPKRFQYTFPTKSGHSIAVNANSHDEALRGVNETLIVDPNLCEMKEIKMPRADLVIAETLEAECPTLLARDYIAKKILDALHAAGFHITEPSDKVFNQPDPLRDAFAGQAMAIILSKISSIPDAKHDSISMHAYRQADAMMKEREK